MSFFRSLKYSGVATLSLPISAMIEFILSMQALGELSLAIQYVSYYVCKKTDSETLHSVHVVKLIEYLVNLPLY